MGNESIEEQAFSRGGKALDCFPANDWLMPHDLCLTTVGCPVCIVFWATGGLLLLLVWCGWCSLLIPRNRLWFLGQVYKCESDHIFSTEAKCLENEKAFIIDVDHCVVTWLLHR